MVSVNYVGVDQQVSVVALCLVPPVHTSRAPVFVFSRIAPQSSKEHFKSDVLAISTFDFEGGDDGRGVAGRATV